MPRWRYANVAATVALVLSVGGVSYAAVKLPANSVGRAQLRPGAVTPRALGFPLRGRTRVDQRVRRIIVHGCQVVNGVAPPCAPPAPTTLTTAGITARGRGQLTLAGLVGVTLPAVSGGDVRISMSGTLDGKQLPGVGTITIPPGGTVPQERQLQYLSGGPISAGRHVLALRLLVAGPTETEVRASPVAITVQVSP